MSCYNVADHWKAWIIFGDKVIKTTRPQCYSMLFRLQKLAAGLSRDIVYVYVMEAGCSGQHPVKPMWNSII